MLIFREQYRRSLFVGQRHKWVACIEFYSQEDEDEYEIMIYASYRHRGYIDGSNLIYFTLWPDIDSDLDGYLQHKIFMPFNLVLNKAKIIEVIRLFSEYYQDVQKIYHDLFYRSNLVEDAVNRIIDRA